MRPPARRSFKLVVPLVIALAAPPALAQSDAPAVARSAAEVPPPGTYVHFMSSASVGDSLRFNNPYRLEHQLGETGESLSLTPPYANFGGAFAFGDPDGWQHGASVQWSRSLSGLPQNVLAPSYMLLFGGARPWLAFARAGLPIVVNPDPNVGGELSAGAAWLFTAGFGLQAELVGNVFYGAATWDKRITTIPTLSLQIGLLVDYEELP